MDSADLYAWLIEATVATSVATLAVLALRRPLRAAFGAGACRAAWSAVPFAWLATVLPAPAVDATSVPLAVVRMPIGMLAAETQHGTMPGIAATACIAWACGCVAFAALLAWQQRRFMRGLGRIADRGDGLLLADAIVGLPAVVGLWKPRIVMPADALERYDSAERVLMLAHEREHIARGDLLANAGVAVLRCLFWFNPLLHFAARRFREDLELACDARVIARHPHSRRAYGEAMLKTQMAAQSLPLGCHWGQPHPIRERLDMLKQPLPSLRRLAGGRAAVVAILLGAGYAAWAAQPANMSPAKPASKGALADEAGSHARPDGNEAKALQEQAISAVEVVRTPPPVYPAELAKQGVTGRVMLIVDVAIDGSVSAVKVDRSAGDERLDAAALAAARQWTFKPLVRNGEPVPSQVRVPIDFEMDKPREGTPPASTPAPRSAAGDWSSYDRVVGSLGAGWRPARQEDRC